MKVSFEGTPEQILREVLNYARKLRLDLGPEKSGLPLALPSDDLFSLPAMRPAFEEPKEQSCPFCHKKFEKLGNHVIYCKDNPDRRNSPMKKYWELAAAKKKHLEEQEK